MPATTTDLEHVDSKPTSSHRLGRCTSHAGDLAFTWKGGTARPACPLCGGSLANTTHLLRAGFFVLEGAELERAERLPGGLPRAITWERDEAAGKRGELARLEAKVAAGEAEEVHCDRYGRGIKERWGTRYPRFILESAERHEAKAARYAKRLARLGGELNL